MRRREVPERVRAEWAAAARAEAERQAQARERREHEQRQERTAQRTAAIKRRTESASASERLAAWEEVKTPGTSLHVFAMAVLEDAEAHRADVDVNRVRALLKPHGPWLSDIEVHRISGHYAALCGLGLLEVVGRTVLSGDSGGNGGKPALSYQLTARGHRRLTQVAEETPTPADPTDPRAALHDHHDDDLFSDLMDGDK